MKHLIIASSLILLSATAAQAAKLDSRGYSCVAIPGIFGTRVQPLPGWGDGASPKKAAAAAIRECEERSPWRSEARCTVRNCFVNEGPAFQL